MLCADLKLPITLAPNQHTAFTFCFSPDSTHGHTSNTGTTWDGNVVIFFNDIHTPDSGHTTSFFVTGKTSGCLSVGDHNDTIAFGLVNIGSTATKEISIKNTTNAAVTVSGLLYPSTVFTFGTNPFPMSLGAGET